MYIPNLQPQHALRGFLNRKTQRGNGFLFCCKLAGVEPTVRQASKFRRKIGPAYSAAIRLVQS